MPVSNEYIKYENMKAIKTTLLASIALLILGISSAYCQEIGYREKDPDGYKFEGEWSGVSEGTTFTISFKKDNLPMGYKDGKPISMELLMGWWQLKNAQQDVSHTQRYNSMARTIENPNILEGNISDRSYGMRYYFTLELVDAGKARWKVTKSEKTNNPKEGAVLLSPPTECILFKIVQRPTLPPFNPGKPDDPYDLIP